MIGAVDLGPVALLRPAWLLLPALALLAARTGFGRGTLAGWSAAVDPPLLAAMDRLGLVAAGRSPGRWLPVAIASLLALALSGPAVRTGDAPTFRSLDGVAILIDVSRSMATGGALEEALAAGRLAAQASAGRPVALIVFAGDAYLASPFTTDAEALDATIAALDGETVPDRGSCLACALALAERTMREARMEAADVVIASDGGGAAAADVGALGAAGARISTLYAAPRATAPDMPGPDPAALAGLAARGGGRAASAGDPGPALATLAAARGTGEATADVRLFTHRDLGRPLLLAPALLALGLFRRRL